MGDASAGTGGTMGDASAGTGDTAGGDASGGTAGTNGTGGSAGTNGTGGSAGTSGTGATGGTAGASGTSGTGGTGGTGGGDAAAPGTCSERCTADADCKIATVQGNRGCRNNTCVNLDTYCANKMDCTIANSWTIACSAGQACPAAFFACIDIGGGVGRCAAQEGSPGPLCAGATIFQMPKLDGTGNAAVCGTENQVCNPATHLCANDCTLLGCPPTTACNNTTKLCGCAADAACAGRPSTPHCNVGTGECECTSSTTCDLPGVDGDVCVNGKCGCTGASACIQDYDGTTIACQ